MKKNAALTLGFLFVLQGVLLAQVKADGARAWEHVRYLASDELKGRRSATAEYAKAAEYIAARMKECGLEPGGEKGSWYQEVPFKNWSSYEPPTRLEILSPERRVYFPGKNRDFRPVFGTGSGIVRAGTAFTGYGIRSEKPAWNDYDGLDVKGRIVIVLPESPPDFDESAAKEWTLENKAKLAAEQGALGMIEMDLTDPQSPPDPKERRLLFRSLKTGDCPAGFVVMQAGRNFLDDLFWSAKKSWRDAVSHILRFKKPHSFAFEAAVEMEVHFVQEDRMAVNVLGVLRGRDPRLKGEYILMGGHLDHLGVGLNGFIYNGADDNATSAATLLEAARVLSASGFKPARTIVFCSWAGEELGLIGSRYYVEHPLYPLEKTVVYLNVDMVGMGDSDLLVGGMWEYGRFFDIVKAGLDPETLKKIRPRINYRGSDHSAFCSKGVTSLSLRTGEVLTEKLDDEHPEYHMPGDRPELIDPELLRLAAQYHVDLMRVLAGSKENLLDPRFRAEFVHKDAAVVDLHNDTIGRFLQGEDLKQDLPKGQVDIPKLKRGGVDLAVFACFSGPPTDDLEKGRAANKVFGQLEALHRLVEQNPDDLEIIQSSADFLRLQNSGKTAVLIGIESGYAIENDLDVLRAFYRAGVRLMTLTHWTHTDWADASGDASAERCGLTGFGEQVVREMNKLGMVIDVSHAHDETFWDVLRTSSAPVIASHSCCRAICDHHRNLSDDMLLALAKNEGLVGINFSAGFLSAEYDKKEEAFWGEIALKLGLPADYDAAMKANPEKTKEADAEFEARLPSFRKSLPRVNVKTVVDHIDHVVQVTGDADHVGLGSDFDGISDPPEGLEDAGRLVAISDELQGRGYKETDIRKILGGNFLRVLEAVEKAARR
jgi:membrane dipeptidase